MTVTRAGTGMVSLAARVAKSARWNPLNPGRYVEIAGKEMSDADFDARMKELAGEFTNLTAEARALEKKIREDWRRIV